MLARTLSVVGAVLAISVGVVGWEVSDDGPDAQGFKTETAAVVIDVIARDRRGQPVLDLRADDFEIYEDGVRQEIAGLEVFLSATLAKAPASESQTATEVKAPPAVSRPAPPSPSFVALVFDRLSPEARALAYKGALAHLETMSADDYVGVFIADLSLISVQTYTNDRVRLRQAIHTVGTTATAHFDRAAMTPIPRLMGAEGDAHPSVPEVASAEFLGRPVDARTRPDNIPAGLDNHTKNTWEALSRDRLGYSTTNGLIAVTSALGALPGRKTVVFFAEGLAIPDAVLPHFRNVVATANRANVAIYTIDAAGLRVHSKDGETGRAVRAAGNAGLELNEDGSSKSNLWNLEANEDVLRKDPRTSLTLLAEQTGGFLVDNTNDLGQAFRRIDADRRFHYLLTYQPKNPNFDGKWRTLTVKVLRRNVTVRARSGYLAVRTPATMPLFGHEGPALAALERTPTPAEIPLRATALVFPRDSEARLAVLVTVPSQNLTFRRNEKDGTYLAEFTILARIRDARGAIVRKASEPYSLSGPIARVQEARTGDVLFFRQPTLPPGSYQLDAVVHDAAANRFGVTAVPFAVPQSDGLLDVSSLVVVRRGERVAKSEVDATNPLFIDDLLIYPSVEEPISRREKAIRLYFDVSAKTTDGITATLEVIRGSESIAALPVPLDAPDTTGRIRQLVGLPTTTLQPDLYTLRLTVSQGSTRHVRDASVTIVD
jgi:VWFA-related protein